MSGGEWRRRVIESGSLCGGPEKLQANLPQGLRAQYCKVLESRTEDGVNWMIRCRPHSDELEQERCAALSDT